MEWTFNEDAPIYLQIVQQFKAQIASGRWQPGEKIPSVRELALEAGVNPNTMQKALAELERAGMVFSQRTAGRFVSGEVGQRDRLQREMASQLMQEFADRMETLGYSVTQAAQLFTEFSRQKEQPGNIT